jgi:hypothetical protein
MKITTPLKEIEAGEFTLTVLSFSDYPVRYTPRSYSTINEEHSLGIVDGVEMWIGVDWLYSNCPDPTDPDHATFFRDYTKEEMSRYKPYWDSSITQDYYRYKDNLHKKQRWGFAGIRLASFVNGIQIGDTEAMGDYVEIGYAPKLNADDFGNPTYLDTTGVIAHWVENNHDFIKKFAGDRRLMAFDFVKDTLNKLGE